MINLGQKMTRPQLRKKPESEPEWVGSSMRFDAPAASREGLVEAIKERIRLGFYSSKDVDTDIADKLTRVFFERDN
jgi:hypothetical protein